MVLEKDSRGEAECGKAWGRVGPQGRRKRGAAGRDAAGKCFDWTECAGLLLDGDALKGSAREQRVLGRWEGWNRCWQEEGRGAGEGRHT